MNNFKKFDSALMNEAKSSLNDVARIQERFGINNDEFLGKIQEYQVAEELGFSLINQDKHGFDAQYNEDVQVFLEIKNATIGDALCATFNDTTEEKAEDFKSDNLWIALGVWSNISRLSFICYGKNEKIGEYLEKRVSKFLDGEGKRSTQTISLQSLVEDYDFRILAVSDTPEDICKMLKKHWMGFIDTKEEFHEPYFEKEWNKRCVSVMLKKCKPFKITHRG